VVFFLFSGLPPSQCRHEFHVRSKRACSLPLLRCHSARLFFFFFPPCFFSPLFALGLCRSWIGSPHDETGETPLLAVWSLPTFPVLLCESQFVPWTQSPQRASVAPYGDPPRSGSLPLHLAAVMASRSPFLEDLMIHPDLRLACLPDYKGMFPEMKILGAHLPVRLICHKFLAPVFFSMHSPDCT